MLSYMGLSLCLSSKKSSVISLLYRENKHRYQDFVNEDACTSNVVVVHATDNTVSIHRGTQQTFSVNICSEDL